MYNSDTSGHNSRYYVKVKEMESPQECYETQGLPMHAKFDNLGIVVNTNIELSKETVGRIVRMIVDSLVIYGFMHEEAVPDVHIRVMPDNNYSYEIKTW